MGLSLLFAFDIDTLIGPNVLPWTVLVVWLFGVASAAFSYMMSFLFTSNSNCQNMLIVFYVITGAMLKVIEFIMQVTTPDWSWLVHFYRIIPTFCLGDALWNLLLSTGLGVFVYECEIPGDCKPWD